MLSGEEEWGVSLLLGEETYGAIEERGEESVLRWDQAYWLEGGQSRMREGSFSFSRRNGCTVEEIGGLAKEWLWRCGIDRSKSRAKDRELLILREWLNLHLEFC